MKEFQSIIASYSQIDVSVRRAAIATIVRVKGSSYRSPGARMLITDDGKWVGSISGGCLEGDALRKARQVMSTQKPLFVTYDTREESNKNLGIGLGCNGIIDVLIEPVVDTDSTNPVTIFQNFIDSNKLHALATVFSDGDTIGQKILISNEDVIVNTVSNPTLATLLQRDLRTIFDSKKSETRRYDIDNDVTEVFLELIQPSVSLLIFGGGFDARPLSTLAKNLGWTVQVTDECVAHIAPAFFPQADKLSLCHRDYIDRDFDITMYTVCVLMSHNYEYDRDVLRKILKTPTPYIGILGPRKRFDKIVTELESEGLILTSDDNHRIHSPIGLDIGAETPDEIAISIIAEIQSKISNRSGGFLKYRTGPIHHRDTNSDQVFKQVYITQSSKTATR